MTTGRVVSVDTDGPGDVLVADVDSLDTVLLVDDASGFDEDFETPQYLVIGDETTPREYTAVENDDDLPNSVTLAVAAGADFEAGLPVTPWDAEAPADDKRAVVYKAWVLLDGQEAPIPAIIPHDTIPVAGAFTLIGASVKIEETSDGEWAVADVLGREAKVDVAAIATPYLAAIHLPSSGSFSVPNATETTITDWALAGSLIGVGANGWTESAGKFTCPKAGRYLVVIGARFASNTSGRRAV